MNLSDLKNELYSIKGIGKTSENIILNEEDIQILTKCGSIIYITSCGSNVCEMANA
jgi:hypothetical protein